MLQTLKELYTHEATVGVGFGDKGSWHSYIEMYYEFAFAPYRDKDIRLLEIGVHKGHSLRMWRKYFTSAEIVGIDIAEYGVKEEGFTLVFGDATNPKTFEGLGDFDIIIDDGSHQCKDQIKTFELLFNTRLKPYGLYVIEDIQNLGLDYPKFQKLHESSECFDLREIKQRYDDVIIEYHK